MSGWSAWGAVPQIFDDNDPRFNAEREQLRALLSDAEWAAARRTTINAHYTHPRYVEVMWQTVQALGVSGRVLEPGSGAGTFIGMTPESVTMTGVELDPITAAISQTLYPQAEVRAESFVDTRVPPGWFDATIGNVPFADVRPYDPRHNAGDHSLHNYFILKSLALTRPGGVVAVMTSRFTMDARNPAARREMNAMADLVGAVRLPTGAHRRVAGTEAVTDLLILRRREPGSEPRSRTWETVQPLEIDGHRTEVNHYFLEHPERVLGQLRVGHGMYGSETLSVDWPGPATPEPIARSLGAQLQDIVDRAHRDGLAASPRSTDEPLVERAALEPGDDMWDGHITALSVGTFTTLNQGAVEPLKVPKSAAAELRALLDLRDRSKALLRGEAATVDDTPEIEAARRGLHSRYVRYRDRYGPINRFTLRPTGRVDENGEPKFARQVPTAVRLLRRDPFGPVVMSLEVFDETNQRAEPAALLTERLVVPRAPVRGVETAEDALAVSMETHGRPDLEQMADLLGRSAEETRTALGQLVYDDPEAGELVAAPAYLSGDVRAKLRAAQHAAQDDPSYEVNVRALRDAVPRDIGSDEIEPRLGAVWISPEDHQQFLREILDDPTVEVEHPGGNLWAVRGRSHSVQATSEWGTDRVSAIDLARDVLEQRTIKVHDPIGDGRYVLNAEASQAAQERAEALQERFAEWVWEDPDRTIRLVDEYNNRFNSIVLRDYVDAGERLTFPGLAKTFTPRPHQRAAVARMLAEPAVGLFHQVGAGKTAEMVIGTMELRRLGLVRKPTVVVPNHMLEQFTREWLQLYPQARLLAASSQDLRGDDRRRFVARTAAHDWDAILMTRGAFERIPVSRQTLADYQTREVEETRAMIATSQAGSGLTVKRLEKQLARQEEALKAVLDGPQDTGITFEESGIDYVVVDEMHDYKNLRTVTNVEDPNARIDGSKRASDLHMKVEYLREKYGDRVITAATATPIANSITEAHVMQRYLRPDLLRAAGVEHFDQWAATFAQTVTKMELAPAGAGNYRQKTRLAKFQNLPEMLRMWHVFADVKTAEDLNLPTPALRPDAQGHRQPQTHVLQPSPELEEYIATIGERAEMIQQRRVDPTIDNMLKVSGDGRKAALDLRLVAPGSDVGDESKIAAAAANIATIYHQTKTLDFLDPDTGSLSPTPGGLQLVFCDLGTPTGEAWNVYDELKRNLVRKGVPEPKVRFIHEAKNDAEKARIFAAARQGHIAVLVGSTVKMGVGTNVQTRATDLHHLDCPWRPADLEQRNGRVIRQGNQNAEVGIHQYVVERSFDAYSWQTVERKARFIDQITRGSLDAREIDDIGDAEMSYATVKALSSGDPLILEKAEADATLAKLQSLRRSYDRNQTQLSRTVDASNQTVAFLDEQIPLLAAAVERRQPTAGDAFVMTVAGERFTERSDAADAIRRWATEHAPEFGTHTAGRDHGVLAQLGGHDFRLETLPGKLGQPPQAILRLDGVPRVEARFDVPRLHAEGIGIVRQCENRLASLDTELAGCRAERERALDQAERARQQLGNPFKHQAALDEARQRSQRIEERMAMTEPTITIADPDDPHGRSPAYDGPLSRISDSAKDGRYEATRWDPRTDEITEVTVVVHQGEATIQAAQPSGGQPDPAGPPDHPARAASFPGPAVAQSSGRTEARPRATPGRGDHGLSR